MDGSGKVELAVRFTLADVAAVIKLAIDGVDVGVEDEGVEVELAGAIGDLGLGEERE